MTQTTGHVSDPVRSPTVLQCCTAAAGLVRGVMRPRRIDQRFIRSIVDAGLPEPRGTVTAAALPQAPRPVPTAMIVEGMFTPARIQNSLTSFIVKHPKATFIVDPAVCLNVEQRAIAQLPAVLRAAVRPPADTIPTITALTRLPETPQLDFALPTHAHWDHVSGLLDMPDLPVHLHRVEKDWISSGPVAPVGGVRDSLRDRPVIEYDLDGPPVLTFTRSRDLFEDNSVILVDLAGHPGQRRGARPHHAGMDPDRRRCRLARIADREDPAKVQLPGWFGGRGSRRDLQNAPPAAPGPAHSRDRADPRPSGGAEVAGRMSVRLRRPVCADGGKPAEIPPGRTAEALAAQSAAATTPPDGSG
jgi:glyoxylase-like metal-dependent hydrolase (beta-lactamase superfamily II)